MRLIRFLRWLAAHRLTRRVLVWLIVRLIRHLGWRRSLRLALGGRRRWRLLALIAWRATVRLIRVGRVVLRLATPRSRHRRRLRAAAASERLGAHGPRRATLPRRLARRRDELRRSLLAAVGVDPDWRPAGRRRLPLPEADDRGAVGSDGHVVGTGPGRH